MPVVVWKNGHEDEVVRCIRAFCGNSGVRLAPFKDDPDFLEVRMDEPSSEDDRFGLLLRLLLGLKDVVVSIHGLRAEDAVVVPGGRTGVASLRLRGIGGFVRQITSASSGMPVLIGLAFDVTLNHGAGYWTRGIDGAAIALPGPVLMYHELIGHALVLALGTLDSSDPETQAIEEENRLRMALGLPARGGHEGGGIVSGGGGGFCRRRGTITEFHFPRFEGWWYRCVGGQASRSRSNTSG